MNLLEWTRLQAEGLLRRGERLPISMINALQDGGIDVAQLERDVKQEQQDNG